MDMQNHHHFSSRIQFGLTSEVRVHAAVRETLASQHAIQAYWQAATCNSFEDLLHRMKQIKQNSSSHFVFKF